MAGLRNRLSMHALGSRGGGGRQCNETGEDSGMRVDRDGNADMEWIGRGMSVACDVIATRTGNGQGEGMLGHNRLAEGSGWGQSTSP